MKIEYIKELNELRKELEIPEEDFKKILLKALKFQYNNQNIDDEVLCMVIDNALMNIDQKRENDYYNITSDMFLMKKPEEAFDKTIKDLGIEKVKKL